jgi:uncharacterized membrane protein
MPEQKKTEFNNLSQEVTSDEKVLGAIAYISLLCLLPLLGKKDSELAQFHGKQGLILVITWFFLLILGMIPVLGWLIILPIGTIVLLIFSVMGIINALGGKMIEIPFIGKYASKIRLD